MPLARVLLLPLFGLTLAASSVVKAEEAATFRLTLQNHTFVPAEIRVPAGKSFKLVLHNADPTPAEFESKTLKFEKVVAGSADVTVNVRPLDPGRHQFVDEYHEDKAVGYVIAE